MTELSTTQKVTEAVVYKVQTLVDGGARVTLDLSSEDSVIIKKLIDNKLHGEDTACFVFIDTRCDDTEG